MPRLFKCKCFNSKPQEIFKLDYTHRGLREVPVEIFHNERTLEELTLERNSIEQLRKELFCCHELRKLNLCDNELREIPLAVGSLTNLREFNISKNKVEEIADDISHCRELTLLDASENPMTKVPDGVTKLVNLTELLLNDCFLTVLPGTIGRLTNLRILELRENQLRSLPCGITRLASLERLDLGNNELTDLPDSLGDMSSLMEVWCDHNELSSLPESIGRLSKMVYLDVSKNCLENLPEDLTMCSSLTDLYLSQNQLQALPDTLGRLTRLNTLCINTNHLQMLPQSIGNLSSLFELSVSQNQLEYLPPTIGLLRQLRVFYVDNNRLLQIPPELGSCIGITVLSMRGNLLTHLPDELGRIPKLRVLNLSNNRLRSLPISFTKFKQLQALWLSNNQVQPLVQLQSDRDLDTGERCLVCYLLPQMSSDGGSVGTGEGSSTCYQRCVREGDPEPPDAWEYAAAARPRVIQFDTDSEHENINRFPKDLHDKAHQRLVAMRQSGANHGHIVNGTAVDHFARHPGCHVNHVDELSQNGAGLRVSIASSEHVSLTLQQSSGQNSQDIGDTNGWQNGGQHQIVSGSHQELVYCNPYDKSQICHHGNAHPHASVVSGNQLIQRSASHNGAFSSHPQSHLPQDAHAAPSSSSDLGSLVEEDHQHRNAETLQDVTSSGQQRTPSSSSLVSCSVGVQGRRCSHQHMNPEDCNPGLSRQGPEVAVDQGRQQQMTQMANKPWDPRQAPGCIRPSTGFHNGYDSDTAALRGSVRASGSMGYRHMNGDAMDYSIQAHQTSSGSGEYETCLSTRLSQRNGHTVASNVSCQRRYNVSSNHTNINCGNRLISHEGLPGDGYGTDTAAGVVSRKPPLQHRSVHQQSRPTHTSSKQPQPVMISHSNSSNLNTFCGSTTNGRSMPQSMTASGPGGVSQNGVGAPSSPSSASSSTCNSHHSAPGAVMMPQRSTDPLSESPHHHSLHNTQACPSTLRPLPNLPSSTLHPVGVPLSNAREDTGERVSAMSSDSGYSPSGGGGIRPSQGHQHMGIPGLSMFPAPPPPPLRSPPPLDDSFDAPSNPAFISTDPLRHSISYPHSQPTIPHTISHHQIDPQLMPSSSHAETRIPSVTSSLSSSCHGDQGNRSSSDRFQAGSCSTRMQCDRPSTNGMHSLTHQNNRPLMLDPMISNPYQPQLGVMNEDEKTYIELTVVIQRNPGLGFSIIGGLSSSGISYQPHDTFIYVSKVNNPGPAVGVLFPGDKLLKANGQDFSCIEHQEAVRFLKSTGQSVELLIARPVDNFTTDI